MSTLISGRVALAVSVVSIYAAVLTGIYLSFTKMEPEERAHFKYPRSVDDAKELGEVLSRYKAQHFYSVVSGVAAVYLM
ncbi:SNARE associated Golgi protein [Aphelenchoides avenae]|nr:SNARE associated Golgi protein [Aphelenchus avenae]